MTDKELFGNSEQLDTISRQAAIDALWHSIEDECGELQSYAEAVISDAEDAIKALPPAQRWIPCKTALPEKENTRAIIQTNAGTVIIDGVYGGTDVYGHHVWRDGEGGLYWDDEIVAWMPGFILEPWKGEQDG